jgi:hypothetical protein
VIPATGGKHLAARQFQGGVRLVVPGELVQRGLSEGVGHAADTRPEDRAGAHRAGLGARVEHHRPEFGDGVPRAGQPDQIGFGVAGRVRVRHDGVLRGQQHLALRVGEQRTERVVAVGARLRRYRDRLQQQVSISR